MADKTERRQNGYWQNQDNAIAEARELMKKHGLNKLPAYDKLLELGYSSLASAISTCHGGFSRFRKLLGQNPLRIENRVFRNMKDWELVQYIINNHFGESPTDFKESGLTTMYDQLCERRLIEVLVENGVLFKKRRLSPWSTKDEWEQYGIARSYNERNPRSLERSKIKDERSWYNKGLRREWLDKFEFEMVLESCPWQTEEEWNSYGTQQGFNKRNPNGLARSKSKNERSWHSKGRREGWIDKFEFDRLRREGIWKTEEEWNNYGVEHGYNERNYTSFAKSKDKGERRWLSKGVTERWIDKFEFRRLRGQNVDPVVQRQKLEQALERYALGEKNEQ